MKNGDSSSKSGAPGGARTHHLLLRRQSLYPNELRVQRHCFLPAGTDENRIARPTPTAFRRKRTKPFRAASIRKESITLIYLKGGKNQIRIIKKREKRLPDRARRKGRLLNVSRQEERDTQFLQTKRQMAQGKARSGPGFLAGRIARGAGLCRGCVDPSRGPDAFLQSHFMTEGGRAAENGAPR